MREVVEVAEVLAELRTRTPTCGLRVPPRRWPATRPLLRLGLLALLSAAGGRRSRHASTTASVKIRVGPSAARRARPPGDFPQSVYLALAQKVADIHGGSVSREPEGKSAFLTLTLPRH